jgi:hypothetical protein
MKTRGLALIDIVRGALRLFALAIVSLAAVPALAQSAATPGTYVLEGGSYTMSVEMVDGMLVVHEPNKDSPYSPQADGTYHFYNDNNGQTYGIRVIDANTLEAFKPGTSNPPSRLVLLNSAVPTGEAVASEESSKWEDIAMQYMERAQTDSANVQSWTACGAVAMKRSVSPQAEADQYAAQMAAMLQQMDAGSSPCPEVMQF